MVQKGGRTERTPEAAPANAWLMAVAAWFVPGAGHLLQGRWLRGLFLGSAVIGMFVVGMAFGGHLFPLLGPYDEGPAVLLQVPPMVANVGSGILYVVCYLTNSGFTDYAKLSTYEYGNTFLLVAGLLNYLVMLDAFDIGAGRKH